MGIYAIRSSPSGKLAFGVLVQRFGTLLITNLINPLYDLFVSFVIFVRCVP